MHAIKYKKTQYGILLNLLLISSIIFLIVAYYFQIGTKAIPKNISLSILVILVFAWLLTYKLTISIDDEYITAIFGIGLLKRKIPIYEIDFNTLEILKPSALTGIGIRLTPKGWLWNVKIGKALFFKTKNNKIFFVGTDDADTIINILSKNK